MGSLPRREQTKRARRLLKNRAPAQMCSRCVGRGGAGLWSSREGRSGGHCGLAPTRYSRREYFAPMGLVRRLRRRTNGWVRSRVGSKQKEPEGSCRIGFPPGILRRCAPRAIAAQWGEPRVRFRTERQTKKSPKAPFCLVLPTGILRPEGARAPPAASDERMGSLPRREQTKRARRLLKNRAPAQMCSRCVGRGGAGLWSSREGRSGGHCGLAPTRYSRREYFAPMGLVRRLRRRTNGWVRSRVGSKQKEPEGSFLFGTPDGNRTHN